MDVEARRKCDDDLNSRDRLSDLQDCILHQILSSFDTKFVIQTSLLSTRWKNLWTTIPSLNLSFHPCIPPTSYASPSYPYYYYPPSYPSSLSYASSPSYPSYYTPTYPSYSPTLTYSPTAGQYILTYYKTSYSSTCPDHTLFCKTLDFTNFVKNVLKQRAGAKIERFRLHCNADIGAVATDFLLSIGSTANEIELSLHGSGTLVLPKCLYESESLRKLKLRIPTLDFPTDVGFPALRELRIHGLKTRRSLEFLSNCSVLESLSIWNCKIKAELIVSAPGLKKLEIINSFFDFVAISSPLLVFLRFEGSNPIPWIVKDACCSLERVDINITSVITENIVSVIMMIEHLQYAKYVTLSLNVLKMLSEADYKPRLPLFPNLKKLELKTDWSIPEKGLNLLLENSVSNQVETSIKVPCSSLRLKDLKIV